MARGALRGAFAAWLGLIALQAVGTAGGSGRIAGAFTDANRLLARVLDPDVPAIPDLRLPPAERGVGQSATNPPAPGPAPAWQKLPVPRPDRYRNIPE